MRSLFPILRVAALFGLLVILWGTAGAVRGQDEGYCYSYDTLPLCCSLSYCSDNSNCIDAINTSTGGGNQTPQWENVTCTPNSPPNGPCDGFSDYVPVDNANCCMQRGAYCNSDDDCCGELVCDDSSCEPF